MAGLEGFKQISRLTGVDQYVLIDQKGRIAAHDIKDARRAADMVYSCGKNLFTIGKTRLRYVVFSRKNQKHIFIFPVGNYYLGVVKQKNMNAFVLADNIIKFIKGLFKEK